MPMADLVRTVQRAVRNLGRIGRAELLLAAVSLLAGLLLVEGGLRLFTVPAFRLASPAFFGPENWFEFDPALEYTLRRGYRRAVTYRDDDGTPRTVELRLGDEGVRGDVPQGDVPLIAFLGDSFTEGYHVDSLQTYPARVSQALAGRFAVANLGVHNYNALNYYKMGVHAKAAYDPQQVFVGLFVGNDILPYNRWSYKPPPNNRFHGFKMRLKESLYLYSWLEMLFKRRDVVDTDPTAPPKAAPEAVAAFFDGFAGIDLPADSLAQYVGQYTAYRRDAKMKRLYGDPWLLFLGVKGTVMVLEDLRRDLGDTPLHVLLIPERLQLNDDEWAWVQKRYPQTYRHRYLVLDELAAELAGRGIAFTDLRERLDADCYLRFDGHFSAEGHRRVAEAVQEALR